MRRYLARILIGLAITLVFVGYATGRLPIELFDRLEHIIYDARLKLTAPGSGDERIVILDIDEKSLGELGRWPWSRNRMARLMDRLFEQYQVALVAFDIVWSERDPSSGLDTLEALAKSELRNDAGYRAALDKLRAGLDYDAIFAASMKGRPVVLGHYLSSEANAVRANAIPEPVLRAQALGGRRIPTTSWNGYTGNLPIHLASAAGAGHFNPFIDEDGVVRSVPMLAEIDGDYYESLSLAVLRQLLATGGAPLPPVEPGFPEGGALEWLQVAAVRIPVDEHANALVPFRGQRFSFRYLSLADVVAGRVRPEQLRGKIALIGTSAPGLQDLRATPVDTVYPGVEVHANMISGMIGGTLKRKPGYMVGAEVLLLLAGGIALSVLLARLSALWATVAALAGVSLVSAFSVFLWTRADLVLPLAASVLMTAFIYTMNMSFGYFVESRSKRQFQDLFGQYVPPELVDRMAADPRKYSMLPRAAELTILFSDVRGFTSISEALHPEALREYINEYLTDMSGIIRAKHNGTLDKYIGDAIMAFWGAPVEDSRHARNAVLAALAMQRECKVLNERFVARGWPGIRIGIGVNTGNVRVGDMGSQVRRAYTVMGDAVNVASRLEGRTKTYGVGILVGEATRKAVPDMVFREIDRIKVKGKDEALSIYEPIGMPAEVDARTQDELRVWGHALAAYRARDWDRADAEFGQLRRLAPQSGLYELYVERCAEMRAAPPPEGWDGVTVFHEK